MQAVFHFYTIFMFMIKLLNILMEAEGKINFTNWVMPTNDILKREFKVEHELKGLHLFDDENSFINAVKGGKIITVTDSIDRTIQRRSRTSDFDSLFRLIRGYRSYPEFRNKETLMAIYDGFKEGKPMEYPIVLELPDGKLSVFSGNTRMDIAFQLGIEPKVIVAKVENND